jgi:ABC-type multidrug transport system fused ATPase/permease subunit
MRRIEEPSVPAVVVDKGVVDRGWRAAVRDRVDLLKRLSTVGGRLLTVLVALTVAGSLMPAAIAVAFAALVGAVESAVAVTATPLLIYVAILLIGHLLGAVREPLFFLAGARIDGHHRAELARMTASSHTIGALERAEVQALIRTARADPEHFMDGAPGGGALVQLELIGRALTLASSGAVLAAFAWWSVPPLVLAALAYQQLYLWEGRQWRRGWRGVVTPTMRADVWSDALVSPGEGKDIRIFGLGNWALDRIERHVRAGLDPLWTVGRRVLAGQWRDFLVVLVPLGIVYVAVAYGAVRDETSAGTAAAVFAAGAGVYQAFAGAPGGGATINAITCVSAFNRLREVLESDPASRPDRPVTDAPPLIRFENVGFAYPGTDRPVLHRLDLDIKPGELLGIVGLNGAGKSTLIKLLAGLYEPTSGRVTVDGADLTTMAPAAWRSRISVVFQDFVRYHLSAADNVALGNAAVPRDDEALTAAARDAGFDEVLARLPHGWDTLLARTRAGGVDLSGGQWQQVVLARALYAVRTGARLLVLDEPTAHLDVRTEFDVFGRLATHRGDATVILISHRLSTVRQADRIVLLSGGHVAESGSHDTLMALGGEYAEMFAIQAERFDGGLRT